MKSLINASILCVGLGLSCNGFTTGLATCDSGPESGWKSQDTLKEQLTAKGWQVRRIKVDGGCYEVYAVDDKGTRVEAYFDPRDLSSVPTKADARK